MIRRSIIHSTREKATRKPPMGPKVWNKHHKNAPAHAIYIGRGSPFGNPFVIGVHGTREEVIAKYEKAVRASPLQMSFIRSHLFGRDLVCFCAPKACHGDVLLKIANEDL